MTKFLWISNAPWAPSGYGSQTRQVGRRIAAAGHDIEYVANDGSRGDREWEGHLVRGSSSTDRYSRDSLRTELERSEADWVIALYDAWVFTHNMRDPFEDFPRMACWTPIDHLQVPAQLYGWLANGHTAIAMSEHGRRNLQALSDNWAASRAARPFEVRYAPHAIEDVYRRVETDFREVIDVPDDAFLIGIVAASTDSAIYDRKGFGDMALALGQLMAAHGDVYVYVHTLNPGINSIGLDRLFASCGVPAERVVWADQYALTKQAVTDEHMATIYSSFDVLLSTSRGEGFGIPVIEAQACGVPVIASNWTAQAELVRGTPYDSADAGTQEHPAGWLVYCDPDWDPRQAGHFGKPIIPAIVASLEHAYGEWKADRWAPRRAAAIENAARYRADVVFERHWKPILAEMADLADRGRPNRRERRAMAAGGRR